MVKNTTKKNDILKILGEVKNEVRQRYKTDIKGIFGSYAKGNEKKSSDIDILVDFDKGADLFDLVEVSMFLKEKLNCKVDVIPRNSIREEIKQRILEEIIYL